MPFISCCLLFIPAFIILPLKEKYFLYKKIFISHFYILLMENTYTIGMQKRKGAFNK